MILVETINVVDANANIIFKSSSYIMIIT